MEFGWVCQIQDQVRCWKVCKKKKKKRENYGFNVHEKIGFVYGTDSKKEDM